MLKLPSFSPLTNVSTSISNFSDFCRSTKNIAVNALKSKWAGTRYLLFTCLQTKLLNDLGGKIIKCEFMGQPQFKH